MIRFFFLCSLCLLLGCGRQKIEYGPYSIGRDLAWLPLQLGEETPNLNAFINALVEEIAKREGVSLLIHDFDWSDLFSGLENQEVAGILTSLDPNKVTEEKYSFSDPLILLGPVLIVSTKAPFASLEEMDNKILAVYQYDNSILIAQKYPSIFIQLYENIPTILEQLAAGEIDGVLMPLLEAQSLVPALYPQQLKISSPPLNSSAIRLITLKQENAPLLRHFNRGLKWAIQSGQYAMLRKKYQIQRSDKGEG